MKDSNREAFEALSHIKRLIGYSKFNVQNNCYELVRTESFAIRDTCELNTAWETWQAAKDQVVLNAQQALHDRLLVKLIREHVERHISEISVNDSFDKGWLAAMKCIQNNIEMLESQEPSKAQTVPEGFVLVEREKLAMIFETATNALDYYTALPKHDALSIIQGIARNAMIEAQEPK